MSGSTTVKSVARDGRAEAQEYNHAGKGPLWTLGPSPRRKLSVPLRESGATTRRTVLGRWRLDHPVHSTTSTTDLTHRLQKHTHYTHTTYGHMFFICSYAVCVGSVSVGSVVVGSRGGGAA